MTKINSVVFAFFVSTCVLSGCSQSTSPSTASIHDIFPLKVGDSWTYHIQNWSDATTLDVDTIADVVVRNQVSANGHDAYSISLGDPNNTVQMYFDGNDLFKEDGSGTFSPVLHYPMLKDEIQILFDTTHADGTQQLDVAVCRQVSEPIDVKAGHFECFHYEQLHVIIANSKADTVYQSKLYFAKNVGLVYEEDYQNFGGQRFLSLKEELISSNIK